jgi:hypothetical protein
MEGRATKSGRLDYWWPSNVIDGWCRTTPVSPLASEGVPQVATPPGAS